MKVKKILVILSTVLAFTLGLFLPALNNLDIEKVGAEEYTKSQLERAFQSGKVNQNGGQICLTDGTTFTLTEGTISGGVAFKGGAVYVSSGSTFIMDGGEISANYGVYGGAIYVEAGGNLILNNGSISFNKAQYGYLDIYDTEFRNYAIYLEDPKDITIGAGFNFVDETNTFEKYVPSDFDVYVDRHLQGCIETDSETYTLVETDLPVCYEKCNGYFFDNDLFDSAYGEIINIEEYKEANGLGENDAISLYTDHMTTVASIDMLTFIPNGTTPQTYSVEITDPNVVQSDMAIPQEYNGCTVTKIAPERVTTDANGNVISSNGGGFADTVGLTDNFYMAASISEIGDFAFTRSNINWISIPKHVKTVGHKVFEGCRNLEDLYIAGELESIGIASFAFCNKLTNITYIKDQNKMFPDTLKSIGGSAFNYCESLTGLDLTGGLETIGSFAFSNCIGLTEVVVGENVTTIAGPAFYGCTSLESLTVPFIGSNSSSTSAFLGYLFKGESYSTNATTVPTSLKNLTITGENPIYANACYGCSGLETLTIGDKVTSVGLNAFYNCSGLKTITIGEGVTSLGSKVFSGCVSVENIYFNAKTVTDLSSTANAFYQVGDNVENGATFTIGSKVTRIPAFMLSSNTVAYNGSNLSTALGNKFNQNNVVQIIFEDGSNCLSIGMGAFFACFNLKNIVNMPASIQTIKNGAFIYCISLESIVLPENLTTIENYAFWDCTNVELIEIKSVSLSDFNSSDSIFTGVGHKVDDLRLVISPGVVKIPAYIFKSTKITAISFEGQELADIGNDSFMSCNIRELELPESLINIGTNAFAYNELLSALKIGENVENIGAYAFSNCSRLTELVIPKNVSSLGGGAFNSCNSLIKIEYKAVNCSDCSSGPVVFSNVEDVCRELIIGKEVTQIPSSLFSGARISSVVFNEGSVCEALNSGCFSSNQFSSINLPDNLKTIGDNAFYNSQLIDITIGNSVKTIQNGAFDYCQSLENVTINTEAGTSTEIYQYAFGHCSSLKRVMIGEGVSYLDNRVFSDCTALRHIYIPSTIETIKTTYRDSGPFCYCDEKLTIYTDAESKLVGWGGYWNYYESYWELTVFWGISRDAYNEGVETGFIISDGVLIRYLGELSSVEIPQGITSIGDMAFINCTGLTTISLSAEVESVGSYVFKNCTGLLNMEIPDSVNSVGNGLFYGCTNIINVSLPEEITSIPSMAFYGCESLVDPEIPESVNSIGSSAFSGCSSLTSISIPKAVTLIEDMVFRDCVNLVNVTLGDNVNSIGENSFENCDSISTINLPYSLRSIGENAFYSCDILENITLPEGVETIGRAIFKYCPLLTTINVPSNVESWDNAFEGSTGLECIVWGEGVAEIDTRAFYDCDNLFSVIIPDSVTSINSKAFEGCDSLEEVVIGDGVKKIYAGAFENCVSLKNVYIPENQIQFYAAVFSGCTGLERIFIPSTIQLSFKDSSADYYQLMFYNCSPSLVIYTSKRAAFGDIWNYCAEGVELTTYYNTTREDCENGVVPTTFNNIKISNNKESNEDYSLGYFILDSKKEIEYDISNFRIA